MCGRFSLTVPANTLVQHFHLKNGLSMVPRYNIAPSQTIPVLKEPETIDFLTWGLVPKWMESGTNSGFINARVETIRQKPSFRGAFQHRRCLVIADGYYEWKPLGRTKQPFYIHREDKGVFAFAGIWEENTCAILTTVAHTRFLEIHDRMPMIVPSSLYSAWLKPNPDPKQLLEHLAEPFLMDNFIADPVSTKVNSPVFDGPECIQPL